MFSSKDSEAKCPHCGREIGKVGDFIADGESFSRRPCPKCGKIIKVLRCLDEKFAIFATMFDQQIALPPIQFSKTMLHS